MTCDLLAVQYQLVNDLQMLEAWFSTSTARVSYDDSGRHPCQPCRSMGACVQRGIRTHKSPLSLLD